MNGSPPPRARSRRTVADGRGAAGVVYLTGLSGAGKSTLADRLGQCLDAAGVRACVLDGDALRAGLCEDLGYSDADRVENMRRVTEVARLLVDTGMVVITALIAPFRAEREAARARFAPGEFMEVFVDAPLSVCEARDPKGLYRRARRGEIPCFTGIDSAYEPPPAAELRVDAARCTPDEAAAAVLVRMAELGLLQGRRASELRSSSSTAGASAPVHTDAGEPSCGPGAGRRVARS